MVLLSCVLFSDGMYSLGRSVGLLEKKQVFRAFWVMTYGGVRLLSSASMDNHQQNVKMASWTYFIQAIEAIFNRPRGWPLIALLSGGMAVWTF